MHCKCSLGFDSKVPDAVVDPDPVSPTDSIRGADPAPCTQLCGTPMSNAGRTCLMHPGCHSVRQIARCEGCRCILCRDAWQHVLNVVAAPPLPAAPQLKVCTVPAAVSPASLKTPPGAATPPASAAVKPPAAQTTPAPANKPNGAQPITVKAAPLAVKGAITEDSGVAFLPSASGSLKVSSSNKP